MKVKQAIKRIVAVAATTGLVGATLAGALATLDSYPAPFVDSTTKILSPSDSVIVVGANAKTTDVLGAIEIAASLQAAAVSTSPVEIPGTVIAPTVSAGVKIEKSGNKLNYGDDFQDVDDKLSVDDLPTILADGNFDESEGDNANDEDFSQELTFVTGTNTVRYMTNDDTDETATFVYVVDSAAMYTYKLKFDQYMTYDNSTSALAKDDLEGASIDMQGKTYTITDAEIVAGTGLDKLTLLAGDTVRWMNQDQPITVNDMTVTVVNVGEDGDQCGIDVDGEYKWVAVGDTEEIGDLTIGVLDAIAVHSVNYDQDTCKISIGSEELILEGGEEVNFNGVDVDGSEVTFGFDRGDRLDYIQIAYTPEDELWLGVGEEWEDPVFGNFKIMFEGMSAVTEDMEFDGSTFTFKNNEGSEVEIPFVMDDDNTAVFLGETHADDFDAAFYDGTHPVGLNRTLLVADGEYCQGDGNDVRECEETLFLAKSSGEARILMLKDVDTSADNKEITLEDVESGKEYVEEYVSGSNVDIDVGFRTVRVKVTEASGKFELVDVQDANAIKTYLGAVIQIDDVGLGENGTGAKITVIENEGNIGTDGALWINMTFDNGGEDNDAIAVTAVDASGVTFEECTDGSDDYCGATVWGTTIMYDNENEDSLVLAYPEEQAFANVFIAPTDASVIGGGASGGSVMTATVNEIPVGLAVLDTDAVPMTKNMIVVGGPCVNAIADELEAPTGECWDGYESGKAKIKVYTRKGKTAILVAGADPQDTLGASYVLKNYQDYAEELTGNEVEVVVASLSDIEVTSVSE